MALICLQYVPRITEFLSCLTFSNALILNQLSNHLHYCPSHITTNNICIEALQTFVILSGLCLCHVLVMDNPFGC